MSAKPATVRACEGEALLGVRGENGKVSVARLSPQQLDTLIDDLVNVYADIAPCGVGGSDRLEGRQS
ncbi:MAG: hypothetical protein Q8Q73_14720 [Stagnimonas sp.]|nr:hypothetical protein [Stagnimonas sp.]